VPLKYPYKRVSRLVGGFTDLLCASTKRIPILQSLGTFTPFPDANDTAALPITEEW